MSTQRLISDIPALRACLTTARQAGRRIGLVPTMGFLHAGHCSLIEASRRDGHFTIVTIFVNPAQFGPNEDFDSYPRDHDRDFDLAAAAGADLVWYPEASDLYPPGSQTMVQPGALAQRLCGLSRPRFFGGICSVVLRFFNLVRPDTAYFGEKDFQQLCIIRRMVADFYMDVTVVGCATLREADGLAMSSRNARLTTTDRPLALTLIRTIEAAREAYLRGERDAAALKQRLIAAWPADIELDYLDFREPVFLEEVQVLAADARLFVGAWLKGVRLIDNAALVG